MPGEAPAACLSSADFDTIAEILAAIAIEAAVPVMAAYAAGSTVRFKRDGSPVTGADEAAEAIILQRLAMRLPGPPVISEEAQAAKAGNVPKGAFFLVDPIDGTREFLGRNGEFTINLGLIVDGTPRAGVVYAPALERLWLSGTHASTCTVLPGKHLPGHQDRRRIKTRRVPEQGLTALISRSHADPAAEAFLAKFKVNEYQKAGSSLKFCYVAEGKADVYPRFGATMEWDTAAGDAVLRVAGGAVLDETRGPLCYGKPGFKNPSFIAWGDPGAASP
ncbi:MAG TPA: 3'(2'),5'-bisphosphate nucleotidase CysQ [Methylocella sp.]|nr:3'(2'),5'-bisphosphate nucleotidase CysQ [Methylocella sp.]